MMQITLKQLEIFSVVAKELSYTQAAKILNMTQPAVSAQMKNLEKELDLKLFDYVGKKLIPTTAGQTIAHKATELKNKIEDFKQYVTDIKELLTGNLNISLAPGSQKVMFFMISAFHQLYPTINIDVQVLDHMSQLKLLQDNKIDLGILGTPVKKTSLTAEPIYPSYIVIAAPIGHPLCQKSKIPLQRLAKEAFILGEHYSNSRQILEEKLAQHLTPFISVDNTDAVKYAIQAGLGLGILPRHVLDKELLGIRYQILDVVGFPVKTDVHLIYRHKKLLSPAAVAFKQFAADYMQQHPQDQ